MDERTRRMIRMRNEYEYLMRMSRAGGMLEIKGNAGEKSTKYVVIVRVPTITHFDRLGKPVYRNVSTVDITIPDGYPKDPPIAMMREEQPWHPNWFRSHKWCSGTTTSINEPLWEYIRRMVETIRFNPAYTNPDSPANTDTLPDWRAAKNKKYFPTDTTPIPNGERDSAPTQQPAPQVEQPKPKSKITIRRG